MVSSHKPDDICVLQRRLTVANAVALATAILVVRASPFDAHVARMITTGYDELME
jgi:hypothetical protein